MNVQLTCVPHKPWGHGYLTPPKKPLRLLSWLGRVPTNLLPRISPFLAREAFRKCTYLHDAFFVAIHVHVSSQVKRAPPFQKPSANFWIESTIPQQVVVTLKCKMGSRGETWVQNYETILIGGHRPWGIVMWLVGTILLPLILSLSHQIKKYLKTKTCQSKYHLSFLKTTK